MKITPRTTDMSAGQRARLSKDAAEARSNFINRKPKSGFGEKYHKKQIAKQYLVKGRAMGGGACLWDVFELDGFSEPKCVGSDFAWQEEAIAFARDQSLGRISLGFRGMKGVFRAGKSGVLSSDRHIELPGSTHVKVRQSKSGLIVG
ncbi:MAG: hypothetical protein CMF11_09330 [Idiomarina sp.]|nr:hypothetical protein [Idiomarina sp.]